MSDVIAGYAGHLVSEQFLEQAIGLRPDGDPSSSVRHAAREQRQRHRIGPATSVRGMFELSAAPLLNTLGGQSVADVTPVGAAIQAIVTFADRHQILLVVTAWGDPLERHWRTAAAEARNRGVTWCALFNGVHLRLINAQRLHLRRYSEFDVDAALDDPAAFAALASLTSRSADALLADSERHAAGVSVNLRDGVLAASEHVSTALVRPARPARRGRRGHGGDLNGGDVDAAFAQALTIVYRMLFLLFAEARSLVPTWHPVYRDSYSLARLRDDAARYGPRGLWESLRAVARLAHAGCRAGDLTVTPFNGRLFAPSGTPLLDRTDLDDRAAYQALAALSTRRAADGQACQPISYRDLGVEQLGAVYETLLDYRPAVSWSPKSAAGPAPRAPQARVVLERSGDTRKSTGTFYTPQSIANYLIRHTLEPLVRERAPDQILRLQVLDPSMGSGAFLVGACAYLAEAYEAALLAQGGFHPTDFGPQDRALFRRTIAERCLYGVDVNPTAVQLARLSMWLTSLAADRPLGFLDHHLVVGNSLLGGWLSSLATPPVDRRSRLSPLPLFGASEIEATIRDTLPVRFDLATAPSDTPQQVRAKEHALAALTRNDAVISRWKRVADLWCARWFGGPLPGEFKDLAAAILGRFAALPAGVSAPRLAAAAAVAARHRFFHWELEFPEVFFDAGGRRKADAGFDAVIGNPPWDMIRDDSAAARHGARQRDLTAATVRFTRDSGVYVAQSDGHANRYQLFAERAIALTRPGGRIGLVLPSGLTADHGSARLRQHLFSSCAVEAIVGFDNRSAIFPIHRSVRFVILTATRGGQTDAIRCRFGETDPAELEWLHDSTSGRLLTITRGALQAISGNALALPEFKSDVDLRLMERAVRLFAALASANGWNAGFGRELNATDDRRYFHHRGELPVVEGKRLRPFAVDTAASPLFISRTDARRRLGDRWSHSRLAYRDVASATNQQTLIAAVLPRGCVSTHTLFCLRTPLSSRAQYFLCGLFNSYVVNYLVRMRVNTHVTTAIVEQLPIPRADQAGAGFATIAALSRALARRRDRGLLARLNARAARLYQLTEEEFAHVLATFPLVPQAERDAAMRAFQDLPA